MGDVNNVSHYRNCTVGEALRLVIQEMVDESKLDVTLALDTLKQFDKSSYGILTESGYEKATVKGNLSTYNAPPGHFNCRVKDARIEITTDDRHNTEKTKIYLDRLMIKSFNPKD